RLRALRVELAELIAAGEAAGDGDALAQAAPLVADGSAIALPVATEFGGKVFFVTAAHGQPQLTVRDLPELTSDRLQMLMSDEDGRGGWLSAFARDQPSLERKALTRRLVEGIGGELWRLLAAPLQAALAECGIKQGARLMLLPSGPLGFLPLGLAQEPSSGR